MKTENNTGHKIQKQRSPCPINLTLELLGDRWTLVVLRDIALGHRRYFRELLNESKEGIAANMLSNRLQLLMDYGLLTRAADPSHKQKLRYSLTERGIQLIPVLAQMAIWGRRHLPVDAEHDKLAGVLEKGGPKLWAQLMDELRRTHLA